MNVALLWLINETGQVLLARRSTKDESDAGLWGPSVSGVIEPGEEALAGILREAKEELGLTLSSATYLCEASFKHADGKAREFTVFSAPLDSSLTSQLVLDPAEVNQVTWMNVEELRVLLTDHPEQVISSQDTALWETLLEAITPKS